MFVSTDALCSPARSQNAGGLVVPPTTLSGQCVHRRKPTGCPITMVAIASPLLLSLPRSRYFGWHIRHHCSWFQCFAMPKPSNPKVGKRLPRGGGGSCQSRHGMTCRRTRSLFPTRTARMRPFRLHSYLLAFVSPVRTTTREVPRETRCCCTNERALLFWHSPERQNLLEEKISNVHHLRLDTRGQTRKLGGR